MFKLICWAAVLCVLAGCSGTAPPRQSNACIPGDPSGSGACQMKTYMLAP